MGKSYRNDAKNDRWRKAKQHRNDKNKSQKFIQDNNRPYRPSDDPLEYHESFANNIGGPNDYAYGM